MSESEPNTQARVAPQTYLAYEKYRWLKLGLLVVALAIAAYAIDRPTGGPSGGSWLGWGLGSIATGAMLWLMWFGVRKRNYDSIGAPLRGWLSAHVYIGLSLLIIVPLHAAFQFGWNVHTLAFALMTGAILTGLVGIALYDRIPPYVTRNRPGQELSGLYEQIANLDAEGCESAAKLPDAFAQAMTLSIEETEIGGSWLTQLLRRYPKCGTDRALESVEKQSKKSKLEGDAREDARSLIEILTLKQRLLTRVRRDIQYKALMDLWLVVHVPLAFASVAAVFVHIFVVFYYR